MSQYNYNLISIRRLYFVNTFPKDITFCVFSELTKFQQNCKISCYATSYLKRSNKAILIYIKLILKKKNFNFLK